MNDKLLYDPWFIAIITFLATVLAWPIINYVINNIKSCFGIFSGQYIGITFYYDSRNILIENITCRQIKNELIGKIKGVAFLKIYSKDKKETIKNEGLYKFYGFVDERLLCISYKTTIKGLHSSGAIVVESDSTGKLLTGTWAGIGDDSIINGYYKMIKISESIFTKKNNNEIMSIAINYLDEELSMDFTNDYHAKSKLAMTLQSLGAIEKSHGPVGIINLKKRPKKREK